MSGDVTSLSTQIAGWLRENAPLTFEKLNPPADEPALAELASALNTELPADLSELLRNFDGSDARDVTGVILLPPGYQVMGSSEIASDTRQRASIWGDAWQPTWIAFGNDLCGGCLVLDTGPQPPYGRIFQFDEIDGPFGFAWGSLTDLLTEMLALVEGRAVRLAHRIPYDYPRAPDPLKPVVQNGELEWEVG
ncbi:SMI1/KNR4 family protein [Micromonospora sp. WMMD558]|uniref:SMI1/KNR4 family protein n=1 Tax=Micromonospora sp. WMMD558 TaxID=3403462 RepID=UPI003BF61076